MSLSFLVIDSIGDTFSGLFLSQEVLSYTPGTGRDLPFLFPLTVLQILSTHMSWSCQGLSFLVTVSVVITFSTSRKGALTGRTTSSLKTFILFHLIYFVPLFKLPTIVRLLLLRLQETYVHTIKVSLPLITESETSPSSSNDVFSLFRRDRLSCQTAFHFSVNFSVLDYLCLPAPGLSTSLCTPQCNIRPPVPLWKYF